MNEQLDALIVAHKIRKAKITAILWTVATLTVTIGGCVIVYLFAHFTYCYHMVCQ
jgi:hypothetical protein